MTSSIKACIQNPGKYNEGKLIYKWVSLPTEESVIDETMKEIGINKEYEEYMIADYEGIEINEYANIYELNKVLNENIDFVNGFMEAVENLSKYDFTSVASFICFNYKYTDIVSKEFMIEDIKYYINNDEYLLVRSKLNDIDGSEENIYVYKDGYENYSSLNRSMLKCELNDLWNEFIINNNLQ